ncbi:MAG TPA: spondin domain-containing protein [Gemmatimonadales bacterium]|nr:spondin domain-containing protein [Gemmatimonadales bacterium]
MSLVRTVSISLSLAGLLGLDQVQAQYRQPWVGTGIQAQPATGEGQVLVAPRPSTSAPAGRRDMRPKAAAIRFTIKVDNISQGEVLKLSNGKTAPFVSAPVLWVVHTGATNPIFTGGKREAGIGLELLAETGNPTDLVQSLGGKSGIVSVGAAALPVGGTAEGPITPGQGYVFEIVAQPGQVLSTAWMFGQSNDLFYSNERPIALFDAAGNPVSGDMTTQLSLWDAGTEVNEEPGLGANQGPRQQTPEAGIVERQGIAHVRDQYSYPRIADVLRLTITPVSGAVSSN